MTEAQALARVEREPASLAVPLNLYTTDLHDQLAASISLLEDDEPQGRLFAPRARSSAAASMSRSSPR
jgi:hypothetical protein